MFRSKTMTSPGELSNVILSGYGKGGKGLVDLFVLKYDLKEFFHSKWVDQLAFTSQIRK